jgi:ABC-type transporter Mla MlaB component
MTQQNEKEGGVVTLQWSGDLTVRRMSELKAQVKKALATSANVSISLATDAECDVTLLQLLCAAHRTASRQGKNLTICGDFPEQFKMVLSLAGFCRHIGCSLDVCGNCLWKMIYPHVTGREPNCSVATN